jgi:hypothetical protein
MKQFAGLIVAISIFGCVECQAQNGYYDGNAWGQDVYPLTAIDRILRGQFMKHPCYAIEDHQYLGDVLPAECEPLATEYVKKRRHEAEAVEQQAEAQRIAQAKANDDIRRLGYTLTSFDEVVLRPRKLIGVKIAVRGFYRPGGQGGRLFGDQSALYNGSNASIGVLHDNADDELMQRIAEGNRSAGMAGTRAAMNGVGAFEVTILGRVVPCVVTNGLNIERKDLCLSAEKRR